MMRKVAIAASALATFAAATPAAAADILVGQWYTFGFRGEGTSLGSGAGFILGTNPASIAAPDVPWTFTLAAPGTLTVLDGFLSTDRFELFDNLVSIGTTSAPIDGGTCGSDISCALGDSSYSSGVFALAAGNHSLTGTQTLGTVGAAFFLVSEGALGAVPEPATWALMIFGFAGIGTVLRRRQKQKVNCSFA